MRPSRHNDAVREYLVRLEDEALFIVPGTGALWTFDFGNKTEVLKEASASSSGPPFQVAQAVVDDVSLFLVLPSLMAPNLGEQDKILSMLREHDAKRPAALIVEQREGRASLIAGDASLVEPAAAATAVVRTCWEWDESETFSITVDQRDYEVVASHDGETWRAQVTRLKR